MNIRGVAIAIAIALSLSLPARAFEDVDGSLAALPPSELKRLKEAVDLELADGPSSRFRSVRIVKESICGKINTKNRAGAYIGFVEFAVIPGNQFVAGDGKFASALGGICPPDR